MTKQLELSQELIREYEAKVLKQDELIKEKGDAEKAEDKDDPKRKRTSFRELPFEVTELRNQLLQERQKMEQVSKLFSALGNVIYGDFNNASGLLDKLQVEESQHNKTRKLLEEMQQKAKQDSQTIEHLNKVVSGLKQSIATVNDKDQEAPAPASQAIRKPLVRAQTIRTLPSIKSITLPVAPTKQAEPAPLVVSAPLTSSPSDQKDPQQLSRYSLISPSKTVSPAKPVEDPSKTKRKLSQEEQVEFVFMLTEEDSNSEKDAALLKLLKKNKSLVNCTDSLGKTPLHKASGLGNISVVRLLLDRHADPNIQDRVGYTALHYACYHALENPSGMHVLKFLLTKDTRVDIPNRDHNLPIHILLRGSNFDPDVFSTLSKGIDPNYQNSNKETLLHNALLGHTERATMLKFVLKLNPQLNVTNLRGETPLIWAAQLDDLACVELLLKAGADPLVAGIDGNALDVAKSQPVKDLLTKVMEDKKKEKETMNSRKSVNFNPNDLKPEVLAQMKGQDGSFLRSPNKELLVFSFVVSAPSIANFTVSTRFPVDTLGEKALMSIKNRFPNSTEDLFLFHNDVKLDLSKPLREYFKVDASVVPNSTSMTLVNSAPFELVLRGDKQKAKTLSAVEGSEIKSQIAASASPTQPRRTMRSPTLRPPAQSVFDHPKLKHSASTLAPLLASSSSGGSASFLLENKRNPSFEVAQYDPKNYESGLAHLQHVQMLWRAKYERHKLRIRHKQRTGMVKEIIEMQNTLTMMLVEISKVFFLSFLLILLRNWIRCDSKPTSF